MCFLWPTGYRDDGEVKFEAVYSYQYQSYYFVWLQDTSRIDHTQEAFRDFGVNLRVMIAVFPDLPVTSRWPFLGDVMYTSEVFHTLYERTHYALKFLTGSCVTLVGTGFRDFSTCPRSQECENNDETYNRFPV